jgi:hypothetical protein
MVQEKKTDDQIKEDATKQQKDVAAGAPCAACSACRWGCGTSHPLRNS